MTPLGAVIMVGGGGETPQERLILAAQRASTIDLIALLRGQGIAQIIVAAPTTDWIDPSLEVICADDPPEPFHFGQRLAALINDHALDSLLYFGGASAPLLTPALVAMITGLLDKAGVSVPSHIVLTNNLHSSDWAAISHLREAIPYLAMMGRDNSLAWELRESGIYEVRVLSSIRPASSMDIDTPSDLAILAHHPDVGKALRTVLDDPRLHAVPVGGVLEVMRTEGKTLALIGRVSPGAWTALNKAAHVWTRVIAEERGMVASERVTRGEVRSMLRHWIEGRGFDGFFSDLCDLADAALFDTRVVFAAFGKDPDGADRFASDLLDPEAIRDDWVREFTAAARRASIPIVLGGHSVVSGGLHALIEIIELGWR